MGIVGRSGEGIGSGGLIPGGGVNGMLNRLPCHGVFQFHGDHGHTVYRQNQIKNAFPLLPVWMLFHRQKGNLPNDLQSVLGISFCRIRVHACIGGEIGQAIGFTETLIPIRFLLINF